MRQPAGTEGSHNIHAVVHYAFLPAFTVIIADGPEIVKGKSSWGLSSERRTYNTHRGQVSVVWRAGIAEVVDPSEIDKTSAFRFAPLPQVKASVVHIAHVRRLKMPSIVNRPERSPPE